MSFVSPLVGFWTCLLYGIITQRFGRAHLNGLPISRIKAQLGVH